MAVRTHRPQELALAILTIEDKSVYIQTCFECLRLNMFGSFQEWPFNCIDSAALKSPTAFSRPHLRSAKLSYAHKEPSNNDTIDLMLRSKAGHDPESKHRVQQEDCIRTRLRKGEARGINAEDFRNYDFIICFEKDEYDVLMTMSRDNLPARSGKLTHRDSSISKIVQLSRRNTAITRVTLMESWDAQLQSLFKQCFLKEVLGWMGPGWGQSQGTGPLNAIHGGVVWATSEIAYPEEITIDENSMEWRDDSYNIEDLTQCGIRIGVLSQRGIAWICGPLAQHEQALHMFQSYLKKSPGTPSRKTLSIAQSSSTVAPMVEFYSLSS